MGIFTEESSLTCTLISHIPSFALQYLALKIFTNHEQQGISSLAKFCELLTLVDFAT